MEIQERQLTLRGQKAEWKTSYPSQRVSKINKSTSSSKFFLTVLCNAQIRVLKTLADNIFHCPLKKHFKKTASIEFWQFIIGWKCLYHSGIYFHLSADLYIYPSISYTVYPLRVTEGRWSYICKRLQWFDRLSRILLLFTRSFMFKVDLLLLNCKSEMCLLTDRYLVQFSFASPSPLWTMQYFVHFFNMDNARQSLRFKYLIWTNCMRVKPGFDQSLS